ncbi:MAG: sulfotransferase family protein, partial [Planctomycetia bacterium]
MKNALLVLGMHRSGTSALTRVMSLLGVDLPTNLLPANEGNETGHWESSEIVAVHDEMLEALGSSWDDPLALPPVWFDSDAAEPYRRRLLELLRRDFADVDSFVVKDPRICRFVGFWTKLLADFDARPRFVLPLRHPLEVAASLKKRGGTL